MKTSLRHLYNYWLPPGHSSGNDTPNPLVEAAVKIQVSTAAMLAGAEVDWDEIKRENEEWFRLLEEARKLAEGSVFIGKADFEIVETHPPQLPSKSASPSAD